VCVTVFAVAIRSVGGHHRDLITIFAPLIGAAFIGTGLLAWTRRPENPFGAPMVAVGFSYCLSALIVATESWPFIFGLHLIALPDAISSTSCSRFRRAGWRRAPTGCSPPRPTS